MTDDMTERTIHHTADNGHVRIEIVDVLSGQRAMFEATSPEAARDVGRAQVAELLRPWWEPLKNNPWAPVESVSDDPLDYAMMLNIGPTEMDRSQAIAGLDLFERAKSLDACADALVATFAKLRPSAHGMTLPTIRFTLALANPTILTERDQNAGYTGYGGNPGEIMMIALPNDFNLPRLAAKARTRRITMSD